MKTERYHCNLVETGSRGFGYAPIRFNTMTWIVLACETLLFTVHFNLEIFFSEQLSPCDDKGRDTGIFRLTGGIVQ